MKMHAVLSVNCLWHACMLSFCRAVFCMSSQPNSTHFRHHRCLGWCTESCTALLTRFRMCTAQVRQLYDAVVWQTFSCQSLVPGVIILPSCRSGFPLSVCTPLLWKQLVVPFSALFVRSVKSDSPADGTRPSAAATCQSCATLAVLEGILAAFCGHLSTTWHPAACTCTGNACIL